MGQGVGVREQILVPVASWLFSTAVLISNAVVSVSLSPVLGITLQCEISHFNTGSPTSQETDLLGRELLFPSALRGTIYCYIKIFVFRCIYFMCVCCLCV